MRVRARVRVRVRVWVDPGRATRRGEVVAVRVPCAWRELEVYAPGAISRRELASSCAASSPAVVVVVVAAVVVVVGVVVGVVA